MTMVGETAAVITALAAAASAGSAVYSATNQPETPKIPKPPTKLTEEPADTSPLMRQRSRARAASAGTRSGTLLTGPLGLTGGSTGGTSTLLGG